MFTLWTSSLLSISSIEEVNLAKPRLPHWRSGPSFRFYIKATSMTLYHQQLSQSSLKESVFSSTNLVSAKCSLEDGSRASPYFQVSSLHRSLQFAFLHRQRTRHITSVGEKSNQDSDKFLQIFLQMFVFPAQGCPLFHANSDKGAPSWCTGAHTTFIIIWSTR